jgi:hypothetical protein
VVRDEDGHFVGALALRAQPGELEIVGMNMARAPFALRMLFQSVAKQADVIGARISCMVEKDAMEKIVSRFGLQKRATLYTREPSHVL